MLKEIIAYRRQNRQRQALFLSILLWRWESIRKVFWTFLIFYTLIRKDEHGSRATNKYPSEIFIIQLLQNDLSRNVKTVNKSENQSLIKSREINVEYVVEHFEQASLQLNL